MNIIEAVKLAQKGKRLGNNAWADTAYLYIGSPFAHTDYVPMENGEIMYDNFFDEDGDTYIFSASDILDNNWIIIDEVDDSFEIERTAEEIFGWLKPGLSAVFNADKGNKERE